MRRLFLLTGAINGLKTNENFAVQGCNNEVTKQPELTISIKPTYLNDNLSWLLNQACFSIQFSHPTVTLRGLCVVGKIVKLKSF